jgi:hypothetical protein
LKVGQAVVLRQANSATTQGSAAQSLRRHDWEVKSTAMTSDAGVSPQALMSSSDGLDVSSPLQIVPEKLAEHTEAFGQAVMQLVAPAAPNEAVEVFGHRLEKVADSLGQIYQDANSSALSIQQAADEAFRRHYELGMHFVEELVHVRTPDEFIKLQVNFFSAQFELIAEQSREMQRQFAKPVLLPWQK